MAGKVFQLRTFFPFVYLESAPHKSLVVIMKKVMMREAALVGFLGFGGLFRFMVCIGGFFSGIVRWERK